MMRLIMTAALAAFASAQCDLTPGTDCSSDTCTYTAAVTGSAATADSCDSPSAVVAAYTPTCDLDAATDATDACPTGCTDVAEVSEVAGPACEFTGDVCPAGCTNTAAVEDDTATTDVDETAAATCTGTSTPTTAYSAADCTGTADEVAEVPATCPATCTGTSTPTTAFAAAYTPTCDLDAATDDTAACPTGCTPGAEVSEVAGPTCEFTGDVVTESDTTACTLASSADFGVTAGTCADADSGVATCAYVAGTYADADSDGTPDTAYESDSCTSTTVVCPATCDSTVAACTDTMYNDQTACENSPNPAATWNAATCTGTSDPTTPYSAADCTGAADEVAEVAEVAGPTCEFTGDSCPATCDSTAAASATAESRLCEYPGVATKVAAEVAVAIAAGGDVVCTDATECPCWGCLATPETAPYSEMKADNSDDEKALALLLTPLSPETVTACVTVCDLPEYTGPVAVTTKDYEMSKGFMTEAEPGNWCGEWTARQTDAGKTCAESIFDAKGLLFLIIIGGALSIIFFECSIMAIVAATQGSKKEGDAKP